MNIRIARQEDLEFIIEMIADDEFGKQREDYKSPLPDCYQKAFEAINQDSRNELIVVTEGEKVIGTLQLTFIPNLTFKGSERCQIEAVRVCREFRGQGLGKKILKWAIEKAKEKGCHLVQLTTNKQRSRAIDFYDELGFKATHEGMKLYL